jgi:uncharacterized membrane protein YesL
VFYIPSEDLHTQTLFAMPLSVAVRGAANAAERGDMASNPHDKPSPLITALDILGNLFTLNLLFLLFSLPIVTIGASVTAMYTVTLRMIDKREGKVFAGFWGAFKKNFKKATIIWMLVLLALVALFGMLLYTNTYEGPLATFYTIFMGIGIVVLAVTLPYLFPLLARFENTVFGTIKNAFLLSISNLGGCIKIILAWTVPLGVTIYFPYVFLYTWYLWLFVLFAVIAYGTSFTARKVFKRFGVTADTPEGSEIKGAPMPKKENDRIKYVKKESPETEGNKE